MTTYNEKVTKQLQELLDKHIAINQMIGSPVLPFFIKKGMDAPLPNPEEYDEIFGDKGDTTDEVITTLFNTTRVLLMKFPEEYVKIRDGEYSTQHGYNTGILNALTLALGLSEDALAESVSQYNQSVSEDKAITSDDMIAGAFKSFPKSA